MFDKIVVITKKTHLEELIEKFNSKSQAKFYIEHSGGSFEEYEQSHETYRLSLDLLRNSLPKDIKQQFIEKSFLPNFLFGKADLILTLGQDGLVINTAKYLNGQPIFAINPDVTRFDGILMPFQIARLKSQLPKVLKGNFSVYSISMAKVKLNDGQELYGVNDIFVGPKSHISIRYSIRFKNIEEDQSSSGIIISTGAGSTGWFKAIIAGARGIVRNYDAIKDFKKMDSSFEWEADYLYFIVREPFPSKISKTNILFGKITKSEPLYIKSQMPQGGVIFSDGIEIDYLEFNSGKTAQIVVADKNVNLIKND